jgi:hypothetical protein
MSNNEVLKKLDRLIEVWIFPTFLFTCKFIKNSILEKIINVGYEILSDRIMIEP